MSDAERKFLTGQHFCLFSIVAFIIVEDIITRRKISRYADRDLLLHQTQRNIAINEFGQIYVETIENNYRKEKEKAGGPYYYDNCQIQYDVLEDLITHLVWIYRNCWNAEKSNAWAKESGFSYLWLEIHREACMRLQCRHGTESNLQI
jgi:hypothetical protein